MSSYEAVVTKRLQQQSRTMLLPFSIFVVDCVDLYRIDSVAPDVNRYSPVHATYWPVRVNGTHLERARHDLAVQ